MPDIVYAIGLPDNAGNWGDHDEILALDVYDQLPKAFVDSLRTSPSSAQMMFHLIKTQKRVNIKMKPGPVSEQLVQAESDGASPLPLVHLMAYSRNLIKKENVMQYLVDVWNSNRITPGVIASLWLKNVAITSFLKRHSGSAPIDIFKLEAAEVSETLANMNNFVEVN